MCVYFHQAPAAYCGAWCWAAGCGREDGVLHLLTQPYRGRSSYRGTAGEEWRCLKTHTHTGKSPTCGRLFIRRSSDLFCSMCHNWDFYFLSLNVDLLGSNSNLPGVYAILWTAYKMYFIKTSNSFKEWWKCWTPLNLCICIWYLTSHLVQ